MATIGPDTLVRWADGTEATLGEVQAGEYNFMSDDYEVVPFPGHTLYKPADFTNEEHERSSLARAVIDGGLGVCKQCGAGEIELDEFATCREYNDHNRALREKEEAKRRGLYWIDLQDLLEDADRERPYVFLDHAADRLMLQVNEPESVCVLTTSAHLRDVLATKARNPSGVTVMTTDMARVRGIPAANVILLGHTRLGSMRNKFHRMIRSHRLRSKGRVICVDSRVPDGIKRYAVAAALGRAQGLFGPYHDFVHRNFRVDHFGFRPTIQEFKPGADGRTGREFLEMCDQRFAGIPDIWKAESVAQNRPEADPHEHNHCLQCDTPYCMGKCQPGDRRNRIGVYPK